MKEFFGQWAGMLTLKDKPGSQPVSILITEREVTLSAGLGQLDESILSGPPFFNEPLRRMVCLTMGTFAGRKGSFGLEVAVDGEPLLCTGSIFRKGARSGIDDVLVGGWTATRQQSGDGGS